MNEREAFEAWYSTREEAPGYYVGMQAAIAWCAWQAALAQSAVPAPLPMAVEVRGMLSNGVEIPLSVRGVYELRDGKTGVFVHMPDADEQPPREPLSFSDEDIRKGVRAFQSGHNGFDDLSDWRAFLSAVLAAQEKP